MFDKAKDLLDNVTDAVGGDSTDPVKGLISKFEANPALIDEFKEDPAAFVKGHLPEKVNAAEIESIVEQLQEAIAKIPLLKDVKLPPISPLNNEQ